jgi:hypothetical protein
MLGVTAHVVCPNESFVDEIEMEAKTSLDVVESTVKPCSDAWHQSMREQNVKQTSNRQREICFSMR